MNKYKNRNKLKCVYSNNNNSSNIDKMMTHKFVNCGNYVNRNCAQPYVSWRIDHLVYPEIMCTSIMLESFRKMHDNKEYSHIMIISRFRLLFPPTDQYVCAMFNTQSPQKVIISKKNIYCVYCIHNIVSHWKIFISFFFFCLNM